MKLSLTDEQMVLDRSIRRFLEGYQASDATISDADSHGSMFWDEMSSLGWLGLPFSEDLGGAGGTVTDMVILMEALGYYGIASPIIPTVFAGSLPILSGAPDKLKNRLISEIIAGKHQISLAWMEHPNVYEPSNIAMKARKRNDRWLLSGEKIMVLNGAFANTLIVTALVPDISLGVDGLTLFGVNSQSPGLSFNNFRLADGMTAANLTFVEVEADCVFGEPRHGLKIFEQSLDLATLASAAEALGIGTALLDRTLKYARDRRQFGTPIGNFQVIQHRLADMYVALEQCRSIIYRAVCTAEQYGLRAAQRDISAAKLLVDQSIDMVCRQSVQLHGGMGMTEELDIGSYFKRMLVLGNSFGDRYYHLKRFANA